MTSAEQRLSLTVNGTEQEFRVDPGETLLEVLRERLALNGARESCGQGVCGTCTVLVDGRAVATCVRLAVLSDGATVETVEGLEDGGLHPLQEAFVQHFAFQCGFCTPGMIMTAKELLDRNPQPSREEIREQLAGNICRCGAYGEIVDAVEAAAQRLRQG
ncbi:(2Fe-2S)-binding protein [Blastococcus deserti]|uniref:(2Fe-2S)-binding protein n=1 Tax=Blastococcus deserti TaxID=2259033 RepID=A0ABW4XEX5_9ACTN